MSVPPVPPLKSSQRLSAPFRPIATVRAVEEFAEPGLLPSGPSMRRATRATISTAEQPRLVQGAVRQAAAERIEQPIIERGRPRVGPSSPLRRQDSTRSPPGTRTPAEVVCSKLVATRIATLGGRPARNGGRLDWRPRPGGRLEALPLQQHCRCVPAPLYFQLNIK